MDNLARALDSAVATSSFGFLWLLVLSAWGGTASYLTRLKKSKAPFSFMELVGEWTISAFAGVVTAYACYEMNFSFYATAACAGIAGHMGGRGIALVERGIERLWHKRFGKGGQDEDQPK